MLRQHDLGAEESCCAVRLYPFPRWCLARSNPKEVSDFHKSPHENPWHYCLRQDRSDGPQITLVIAPSP